MKKEKKLTISMTIFGFLIFIAFGVIVMTEKLAPLNEKKIDKRLNDYIETNYKDIINEINIGSTKYKNTKFTLKVTNKQNKKLYFYLYYSNKKITSTYKNDYLKGKPFLKNISTEIENNVNKTMNSNYKVNINTTLDNFTSYMREKIIKEDNIQSLKIYNLESNITVNNWTILDFVTSIKNLDTNLITNEITPKTYTLTIYLKADPSKVVKINNLTTELIESDNINLIISDIINKKKSNLLTDNNITYKYLN